MHKEEVLTSAATNIPQIKTGVFISPELIRENVYAFFSQGFDCAESIVRTFTQMGFVDAESAAGLHLLSTGLGRGMGGTHGPCGALNGAVLVLNAIFGPHMTRRKLYRINDRFLQLFLERFEYSICSDLLKHSKMSCKDKTAEAAIMLSQYLQEMLPPPKE